MTADQQPLAHQAGAVADRQTPPGPLIRLADVPRLKWLPRRRGGTRLAVPTVHRWADKAKTPHLRTIRVGGCRCTTEQWLREFFAALSGDATPATPATPARSAARRRREVVAAERDLAADGFPAVA